MCVKPPQGGMRGGVVIAGMIQQRAIQIGEDDEVSSGRGGGHVCGHRPWCAVFCLEIEQDDRGFGIV